MVFRRKYRENIDQSCRQKSKEKKKSSFSWFVFGKVAENFAIKMEIIYILRAVMVSFMVIIIIVVVAAVVIVVLVIRFSIIL